MAVLPIVVQLYPYTMRFGCLVPMPSFPSLEVLTVPITLKIVPEQYIQPNCLVSILVLYNRVRITCVYLIAKVRVLVESGVRIAIPIFHNVNSGKINVAACIINIAA